jgi:hypothetical protein
MAETQELDCQAGSRIVEFFVRCPPELKPSLNKAIFFISEDGFSNEYPSKSIVVQRSPSKLKAIWVALAPVLPFTFASDSLEMDIYKLAADDVAAFETVLEYFVLKKGADVIPIVEYFLRAHFFQETLLAKLSPDSRERFSFIPTPKQFSGVTCAVPPFSEEQLMLIRQYRAPKSI